MSPLGAARPVGVLRGPRRPLGPGLRGYWDEALVASEATQCCWKLGDTAAVQPSLWWGSLAVPPAPTPAASTSAAQGGSWPLMLPQQPGLALHVRSPAGLSACSARSLLCRRGAAPPAAAAPALWPCSTVAMWFSRSVKNSLTPS